MEEVVAVHHCPCGCGLVIILWPTMPQGKRPWPVTPRMRRGPLLLAAALRSPRIRIRREGASRPRQPPCGSRSPPPFARTHRRVARSSQPLRRSGCTICAGDFASGPVTFTFRSFRAQPLLLIATASCCSIEQMLHPLFLVAAATRRLRHCVSLWLRRLPPMFRRRSNTTCTSCTFMAGDDVTTLFRLVRRSCFLFTLKIALPTIMFWTEGMRTRFSSMSAAARRSVGVPSARTAAIVREQEHKARNQNFTVEKKVITIVIPTQPCAGCCSFTPRESTTTIVRIIGVTRMDRAARSPSANVF